MPGIKSPDPVASNMKSKPCGKVAVCREDQRNETIGSISENVMNITGAGLALSWPQGDKLMPNLQPPYSRRFLYPICTRGAEDSGKSLELDEGRVNVQAKIQEIWPKFYDGKGRYYIQIWRQFLSLGDGDRIRFLRSLNKDGAVDIVSWRSFLKDFDEASQMYTEVFSYEYFTELFNKYDGFRNEHCDPVIDELLSSV